MKINWNDKKERRKYKAEWMRNKRKDPVYKEKEKTLIKERNKNPEYIINKRKYFNVRYHAKKNPKKIKYPDDLSDLIPITQ